jgi:hypothetical protein
LEPLLFTPLRHTLIRGLALTSLAIAFTVSVRADELSKPKEEVGKQPPVVKPSDMVRKPTAEDRSSRSTARAKGDLTFDDLKFDIEKGAPFERSMLPKEIEELNKKTIRIRGWILPASVFKQVGIDEFVLVRDNQECCFGPGAALYDCIMIKMEKGKTANYTTRPVAVKGKFEVEELKFPDGKHYAIYKMTATEVK